MFDVKRFATLRSTGYFNQIKTEYDYFTAFHSDYGTCRWPTAFPDSFKEHVVYSRVHKKAAMRQKG